ncbi:hypothetical protein [Paraburkholderia sp. J11-2]|nr:hypothetical protein [Paraburkholderia sp. J11-2]
MKEMLREQSLQRQIAFLKAACYVDVCILVKATLPGAFMERNI